MSLALALTLLALGLRSVHLDWGLPEVYEEATPVREAIGMWGTPGRGPDLNPHFFKYPSFSFYLNFSLQAIGYLWLSITGVVGSLADFRQLLDQEFGRAVLAGRWVSAVLGSLTVLPVIALGRALGGRLTGLLSGAVLAVLPLAVAESRVAGPDVLLLWCSTCALVAMTRWVDRNRGSHALSAGIWMGLAAAAKYPGALLAAAAWTANAVERRNDRTGPLGWVFSARLVQVFGAAVIAFAVASPYVLLDLPRAMEDIAFERGHMALGHLGREGGRAWGYYLFSALPQGATPGVVIAAALGVLWLVSDPRRRASSLPGLVFALLTLGVLGSWRMAAPRYLLPLAALLSVWAAVGVRGIGDVLVRRAGLAHRLRSRNAHLGGNAWSRGLSLVLFAGLLVPAALVSWNEVRGAGRIDSRAAAAEWIAEHVPQGSAILVERYGPEPDPTRYAVTYLPFHGVSPHIYDLAYVPALYAGFDVVVFSSGVSARYLADIREYPLQAAFYRAIEAGFREEASFTTTSHRGPEIRILFRREGLQLPRLDSLPANFFASQKGNRPLAEYFSGLGTVLVRRGEKEDGFRLLEEAVAMDPGNGKAWGNLGAMRFDEGRLEEALTAFRRAAEAAPQDAQVLYNLGLLYDRMGEARQAVEAFQSALLLDRGLEDAYLGLARALVEDDRYEAARSVLHTFLERFPRSGRRVQAEAALRELALMGPGRS